MAEPAKKDPKAPIPVVTPTGKVGYLPPELAADAGSQGLRGASDRVTLIPREFAPFAQHRSDGRELVRNSQ